MTHKLLQRISAMAAMALLACSAPALAQIQSVDPNDAIDADLNRPAQQAQQQAQDAQDQAQQQAQDGYDQAQQQADNYSQEYADPGVTQGGVRYDPVTNRPITTAPASGAADTGSYGAEPGNGEAGYDGTPATQGEQQGTTDRPSFEDIEKNDTTYQKDDLIGAAEGVFGKGAEGLAGIIEDILRDQGEPNAYIVGREASGAFIAGLRYGSGTLFHKIEGKRPVYWTGPSVGFDAGANAGNSFVLVYNLYDSQDLYKRFPAGEGALYVLGGFHTSYLRRGDIVLIPVRLGVGLRIGANVGYMKITEKRNWMPF